MTREMASVNGRRAARRAGERSGVSRHPGSIPRSIPAVIALMLSLAIVAVGGLAGPAHAQDRGGYSIRNLDADLRIQSNGDLLVEERVVVDFAEPRHGIYRTIPVRYSDPKGYAYSLRPELIEVVDDAGNPYPTRRSNEGRYWMIRIGDANVEVVGTVVYRIRYRVRNAVARFAEHDELYWNATGHEWNATIARSSATVHLPTEVAADDLLAAGYTGGFGLRERAVEVSHREPGVVRFVTTRSLGPLEGLTVAVGFPHGVVTFPTASEWAIGILLDNGILIAPFLWLGFLFARYRGQGRDPHANDPIVVTYEPPPGMSAGGIGTLIDERVDLVDITATIVDLAIRGHLTIRAGRARGIAGFFGGEETTFLRNSGGRGDLLPHERRVLEALFARGNEVDTSDLRNSFYTHLPGIRRALYDHLVDQGHYEVSPSTVRNRWVAMGVAAGVLTGATGFAWAYLRDVPSPASAIVPVAAGVVTALLFAAFSFAMPRRTLKGARARRWALGFQEFARRVEGDRLNDAASDPRREFEALLPYAMALGVASEWAKKYEGIYASGSPRWYVGDDSGGRFSTRSFERMLSTSMSKTGDVLASSPRSSSGSGGGGFSGGGGGGGGGGSW